MRTIDEIIIHCTATPEGREVTAADVTRWHKQRGFQTIGYHYLIRIDGTIEDGRPLTEIGAHCKGHNAHSIGICYVGGLAPNGKPKNTLTPAQTRSLIELIRKLKRKFGYPTIHGHNEYANKACPSFDVQAWKKEVGLL